MHSDRQSATAGLAAISFGADVVGSSPALAQDTIDAEAKPYFVLGGIVAAVLFFTFGGYFPVGPVSSHQRWPCSWLTHHGCGPMAYHLKIVYERFQNM